jgi:hypothetical protein
MSFTLVSKLRTSVLLNRINWFAFLLGDSMYCFYSGGTQILDTFAQLRTATVSFIMPAHQFICLQGTTKLPQDGTDKSCLENQNVLCPIFLFLKIIPFMR